MTRMTTYTATRNDLLPGLPRARRTHLLCVQDVATAIGVSKPTVVRWVAENGRAKDVLWLPAPDFEIGGTVWAWHPTSIEPVIAEMRRRKETARERDARKATAARKGVAWLAARRDGAAPQDRKAWHAEQRAKGKPNFD